jgi:hypothetical protein
MPKKGKEKCTKEMKNAFKSIVSCATLHSIELLQIQSAVFVAYIKYSNIICTGIQIFILNFVKARNSKAEQSHLFIPNQHLQNFRFVKSSPSKSCRQVSSPAAG